MLLFKSLFKVRNFLLLSAALSGLTLAGCGYRPLYGQASTSPTIRAQLSSIEILPIGDRVGQQMRTELGQRLHPRGQAGVTTHQLRVALSQTTQNIAIAKDTSATRANLRLNANYRLVRQSDQFEVMNGSLFSTVSHNILESEYATLIASKDARNRAISDLSEQLERAMAIYFSKPATK